MTTKPKTLQRSVAGPIGHLTLTQPDKLNPLSAECLEELATAAAWFDQMPKVKVLILSGSGRAFCAGADLSTFTGQGDRPPHEAADLGRLMVEAIESMKAVTISAVHGHCVGGGVLLAAACDLRLASESARWAIPEVDIGIPLAWGGIPRLVREIGPAATRDLVLTCRPFTSAEALSLGLVNEVLPDHKLMERASELAQVLASKSTLTLRSTLMAVDAAAEALVSTAGSWSDADTLVAALHDPESREVAARYLSGRSKRT